MKIWVYGSRISLSTPHSIIFRNLVTRFNYISFLSKKNKRENWGGLSWAQNKQNNPNIFVLLCTLPFLLRASEGTGMKKTAILDNEN